MTKIVLMIWLILLGILIGGPGKAIFRKYKERRAAKDTGPDSVQNKPTDSRVTTSHVATPPETDKNEIKPEPKHNEPEVKTEKTTKKEVIAPKEDIKTSSKSNPIIPGAVQEEEAIEKEEEIIKKTAKEIKEIKEIKLWAISHRERKKRDQYEKKLIEWLAIDPQNQDFLEMLSEYYFDTWSFIKAMTLLKKLVNNHPDNHKAIRQIWQVYIQQKDLDTAKILIEKAITIKDDDPKYFISLVDIHYTKNNLNEAIKAMEKILKLRPTSIDYLMSIATLHEENAQPTKAFHYYSKIIELDAMNENAKAWLRRLG